MRIGEIMGGDTSYHENYSYDAQTGLLTGQGVSIINSIGNFPLLSLSYGYTRGGSAGTLSGKTGQMTHITDNLDRNRDRKYEFDAIGRLSKAKGGLAAGAVDVTANWTQEYSYDRYGNKTGVTASGVDRNNTTVPVDGLAAVSINTSTNRITTSGWDYDLTGNVVRGQNASGVWQRFEYDAAGRLVEINDDSNSNLETYTYGATRERLITTTSAGRTYYVWGGQSVIAEYTETGTGTIPTFTKSYVYAGSRLLAVSYSDGLLEFHHPDRIGTQLVTFGGSIGTVRQSTYPFGTLESGPRSNQVFTSYDRSTSTGLDYALNRTYSSGQSRFTQVDPIGMAAASLGNPQSNNMYAYVQNMPTDFVDPSGLNAEEPIRVHTWTWGWSSDFLRFWLDSISHSTRTWGDSGGGGGGGGGRGGGVGGGVLSTPNATRPKDYNNCVWREAAKMVKRSIIAHAQMYAGAGLMGGSSAFALWAVRFLGRHAGPELARGNVINGVAAPDHAAKLAAIGIPGYYAGMELFSRGMDMARLNASATNMAIRHCRTLFPNSR